MNFEVVQPTAATDKALPTKHKLKNRITLAAIKPKEVAMKSRNSLPTLSRDFTFQRQLTNQ